MSTSRPTGQSRIGKSLGAILSRPRPAVSDVVEDDAETVAASTMPELATPAARVPAPEAAPTTTPVATSAPVVGAPPAAVPAMPPAEAAPAVRATSEPVAADRDAPVAEPPVHSLAPQADVAVVPRPAPVAPVGADLPVSAALPAPSQPTVPNTATATAEAAAAVPATPPAASAMLTAAPTMAPAAAAESWSAPVVGLDVEEERVPAGKKRETFLIPTDLADEMRDAVVHLAGPPLYLTLAAFGEHAVRRFLEQLKQEQNGGAAFPKRPRPVRQGRPLR